MQDQTVWGLKQKKEKLMTEAVLNRLLQSAFSLLSNHKYIMNVMKELKWQMSAHKPFCSETYITFSLFPLFFTKK